MKIDPSYSVARFKHQETIHFKAKLKEDFNGNRRLMDYKLKNTSGMLKHFCDVGGNLVLGMMEVSENFDKIINAEHGDSSHISQRDLDN